MTRPLVASVIVLVFTAASAPALADVIMPPPRSCFEGSRPASGHIGPHCRPALCKDDRGCRGGKTCQSRKLCMQTFSLSHRRTGRRYTIKKVKGVCPHGKTCSKGKCKELKVCAKKPEAKKPEAKKPETKKPEAKKPETKKPEAKKPETKKPETKKPETKKPEAKKPEAKKTASRTAGSTSSKGSKKSGCSTAGDLRSVQFWPLLLLLLIAALRGRYLRDG